MLLPQQQHRLVVDVWRPGRFWQLGWHGFVIGAQGLQRGGLFGEQSSSGGQGSQRGSGGQLIQRTISLHFCSTLEGVSWNSTCQPMGSGKGHSGDSETHANPKRPFTRGDSEHWKQPSLSNCRSSSMSKWLYDIMPSFGPRIFRIQHKNFFIVSAILTG